MKPILFNNDMVRAILDNRKTVTRRVVKPQPEGARTILDCDEDEHTFDLLCWNGGVGGFFADWAETINAPFWPGDILYVRETWCINNITPHDPRWIYKADYDCTVKPYCNWIWRPSIHMPREAARIFLQVINVYPQQLKDVTEKDAIDEGFSSRAKFISAILKMYPGCTDDSWFWANEFKRISKEEAEHGKIGVGQA